MKINQNMGRIDRVIRIALTILIGFLYFSGTVTGVLGIILLVLGVVFILTSLFSFCPLYLPFIITTKNPDSQES